MKKKKCRNKWEEGKGEEEEKQKSEKDVGAPGRWSPNGFSGASSQQSLATITTSANNPGR
jgi:hypothetical protein